MSVGLCVRAVKGIRLELSRPKSMSDANGVKKKETKGRRLRSHGYEKCHGRTLLVKCAAAAAGVGLHVDRTAHVSSYS